MHLGAVGAERNGAAAALFLRELPCTCHVPRSVSKPVKGSLGLFLGAG